jgi:UDP-N-acetylglucosamine diphosphorylase/glucosamine-1-phosphate N-acetyltransferase
VTALYLYDDAIARRFEPFALTRPISELRAGAEIIRRRWERIIGVSASGFISSPHLKAFEEGDAPRAADLGRGIPSGSWIVNSRFVPSLAARPPVAEPGDCRLIAGGHVAGVRITRGLSATASDDARRLQSLLGGEGGPDEISAGTGSIAQVAGRWLENAWAPIDQLVDQLTEDIAVLGAEIPEAAVSDVTVIGGHGVFLEPGVRLEPYVMLDVSQGPVLIRRSATIAAFTRIVGPTYIGENATIVGDAIRACSIGEVSKVRGEISNSILLGHSNKSHTGFVGHSYLGRWVNLGAGTTTSNLKNTYGSIQVRTGHGVVDTGLQFLGSLIGDHVKTGIGMMLTTGSIIGAGANVFGRTSPKYVPPFAWGENEPYERYDLDKFLAVAERMMERRHVELSGGLRQALTESHRVTVGR